MAQNPSRMNAVEIFREIQSLRDSIDRDLMRIAELAATLHARARHRRISVTTGDQEPENPAPYIAFSNGWTRMAGSLRQGILRMNRTDRIFSQCIFQEEAAPARSVVVAEPVPQPKPASSDDSMEELMALYGKEIVNDAASR